MYDDRVRQLFMNAKIPETENAGSDFGNSLYNLAEKLLPTLHENIKGYLVRILKKEKSEVEILIEECDE